MDLNPLDNILSFGETIVDKIWKDADAADQRKFKLRQLHQQGKMAELEAEVRSMVGQLEVNKAEANHKSIFVAGWRPAVGWTCAAGLAWNFIVQPILTWIAFIAEVDIGNAPKLDITELITILMGMLGLGTMRMNEKVKGVASDTMRQEIKKASKR